MMIPDDSVSCSESRKLVWESLEDLRYTLVTSWMKVIRTKTDYIYVNHSEPDGKVKMQGAEEAKEQR